MSNNTGLGRGLGSLIPNKNTGDSIVPPGSPSERSTAGNKPVKNGVLQISVDEIEANPHQPRSKFSEQGISDLVESIKEYGVIQPLIVTRKGGGYELIAGERRLRASREAGLATVPVIVRDAGEQEKLELALIENIQRENLNPIELAKAYRQLIDEFNLSQEDMAKRVSKARPSVTNTLRLLNLPEDIQQAITEGKLTEGHAKYLLGLEDEDKQMMIFRKILHNNLTITDTSKEVRRIGGTKAARIKINYADKDKEFALREFFGTRAEIKRKGKGGQIIIDFFSDDELQGIIDKVK
jgi:ParB family chromosome partitioning protein